MLVWNDSPCSTFVEDNDGFRVPSRFHRSRPPYFFGREKQLEKIQEYCSTRSKDNPCNTRILISGVSGIGKTQLAVEYAYQQREQYSSIFWVNAGDEWSLQASFAEIAQDLLDYYSSRLSESDTPTLKASLYLDIDGIVDEDGRVSLQKKKGGISGEAVTRWMARPGNHHWLLILDNIGVSNIKEIEYLRYASKGTMIVTSQYESNKEYDSEICLHTSWVDEMLQSSRLLIGTLLDDRGTVNPSPTKPSYLCRESIYTLLGQVPRQLSGLHACYYRGKN